VAVGDGAGVAGVVRGEDDDAGDPAQVRDGVVETRGVERVDQPDAVLAGDGVVRTDAGLMTGDGKTGAACAMPGVEHAVDVARLVERETPHVLLAGDRAVALAEAFEVATDCDLWTPATRTRWADADPPAAGDPRDQVAWVREHFGNGGGGHDTVGAVASDGTELAAATSTGGRWFALAGRVGDVPQVGGGFYR
jgi:isoaspartyl peptidase/L-asparaginase-like protein (Ntn-hydrolase superfamily)